MSSKASVIIRSLLDSVCGLPGIIALGLLGGAAAGLALSQAPLVTFAKPFTPAAGSIALSPRLPRPAVLPDLAQGDPEIGPAAFGIYNVYAAVTDQVNRPAKAGLKASRPVDCR
jgi:hypothetical protein